MVIEVIDKYKKGIADLTEAMRCFGVSANGPPGWWILRKNGRKNKLLPGGPYNIQNMLIMKLRLKLILFSQIQRNQPMIGGINVQP